MTPSREVESESVKRKKTRAINAVLFIIALLSLYHLLILFQVIDYDKVWAGRLESVGEMRQFEVFSLLVIAVIVVVFLIKKRQVKRGIEHSGTNLIIWTIAAFFGLNTVGNLFSTTQVELILGTALTLALCGLSVFIARK